ncbi:Tetratricopeptide repeat-containing protein [Desulfocicer vacuolatum DSM 3385]|uniref:Tetratricopeptide repeat-containing protein n=1 Tax=Desulfocicer vacuolatum DSM 3385 TaxID=1121400 RepID=A0A1W2DY76_9BACT|nr:tetratricopeptide repeat protein [Desulfocicer vacuolatum]SMD02257.1 Tetratricopeptide repeat-containing protein [Desulfocicer vacuolatum DSM 3385]
MIKYGRILTFFAALGLLGLGVFVLDAKKELNLAYKAYEYRDMDQAMRHARRTRFAMGNDKKIMAKALKLQYAIAVRLGHPEKAISLLGEAIQLEPDCGLCYLRRGDLAYTQKNYTAALDDFKKGFENSGPLKPATESYYYARRGLSCLAVGENKNAEADSRKALASDPGSALAFFLESKVRDRFGDIDGAYGNALKAYGLGRNSPGFFSSQEGDFWLRYYGDISIRYKAAHRHDL